MLGTVSRAGTARLTRLYQRTRTDAGLAPDRETFATMWYSPRLVVGAGSAGLDYPRTDLPDHIHFVGDLTDDGSPTTSTLPDWWADVAGAAVPVVHVTQGTANVDPHDLILPALEALAGEDVLVVVGLGDRTGPLPGPLPTNARVAPMIPYPDLLPRTSVVLTNGGYGGSCRPCGTTCRSSSPAGIWTSPRSPRASAGTARASTCVPAARSRRRSPTPIAA